MYLNQKSGELALQEIKFVKPKKVYTQNFSRDIVKMNRLTTEVVHVDLLQRGDVTLNRDAVITRYLTILWSGSRIIELINRQNEDQNFRLQVKRLLSASIKSHLVASQNGVLADKVLLKIFRNSAFLRLVSFKDNGWLRIGTMRSEMNRFFVITLKQREYWTKLQ